MKRLLRNIVLLLLPIFLYYALFLAFEPNNFFGIRSTTPSGAIFGALRQYDKNPQDSIILGDSRLAHINMEQVEQVAGKPYANLAFGGASLKEQLDELDWLLARYPNINEVVLTLSFYTVNAAYNTDRFETIETALTNPFAYLCSLDYNLLTFDRMLSWLRGETLDGGATETEDPADYQYAEYTNPTTGETVLLRTRIIDYINDISRYTRDFSVNTEQLERLLNTIESFQAAGIRFIVVLPPMEDTAFQYEVVETGIAAQMEPLLAQLRQTGALVLDYELTGRLTLREDQYFDGFHLDYKRGLPEWTDILFTDIKNATA